MKVDIVQKNYSMSEKLEDIIRKKTEKLAKYFNGDSVVKVLLKRESDIYKMEVTATFNGSHIRSEISGENMYSNIDIILPKIEKQIIKNKDKLKRKFKDSAFKDGGFLYIQSMPADEAIKIVKTKRFSVAHKTAEEAVMEMNMLEHDFYVYLDSDTDELRIVYRREDGNAGVLIPEAQA